MAENLKASAGIDALKDVDASAEWWKINSVLSDAAMKTNTNMLCLLNSNPDTDSESGMLISNDNYGKPCIEIDMGLKWSPSSQVRDFCVELDKAKYGAACIYGGEYMCANGDETAFIFTDADADSVCHDCFECPEFINKRQEVCSKAPSTLREIALRTLFDRVDVTTYFWEGISEAMLESMDDTKLAFLNKVAKALDFEDAEELIENFGSSADEIEDAVYSIEDEDLSDRLHDRWEELFG
jgi:hypothetical protein